MPVKKRCGARNGRQPTTPKAIVALRADPRVREIDDERAYGNGFWLYLSQGWSDDADAHVVHADTAAELAELMRYVRECDCEQCVQPKATRRR